MIIGARHLFTREHYEAQRGFAPGELCELVVHCLELVAQLARTDLEFRFKGGNSQLILLDEPQRFSIDVDIVSTVTKERMIEVVEGITADCDVFTRCEVRQHKTKPWLPMISFKLYFDSAYESAGQGGDAPHVMLDAVLEAPPYGGVRQAVRCRRLYHSDQEVELPSIAGLLADKMLCIGPGTMGIPLGKGKEAHRLKHVFDVANLSRHDYELEEMRTALAACMVQENKLQRSEWDLDAVVQDTAKFCSEPLAHATKPADDALEPGTYLDEIARGFDEFRTVLFRVDYTWERFQDDCRQVLTTLDRLKT
jgi:hypothetical protein